jgi:hypothetical protein
VDLGPGERCRHAGVTGGAHAVDGGQRLAADVLQIIDVHAPAARVDGALDGRDPWMALGDERGDDLAEETSGLVRRPRRERDVDVQPLGARRLGDGRRADALELVVDPPGDVHDGAERHAGHRIEVEHHVVGVVERADAREPRVLRDGADLHREEERRQRAADQARGHLAIHGEHLDTHPPRHVVGRALLVERLAANAVGEPPHDQRPVGEHRKDVRRGPRVVAHQRALGESRRRPEDLVQMRHRQLDVAGEPQHRLAAAALDLGELLDDRP